MPRNPTQTDPRVLRDAMTTTTEPNCRVIQAKLFHHNNLVLQLLHDTHFNVYRINVYRINDRSNSDLWGIWDADDDGLTHATAKFNKVRL
jgi:hypothetical protein